MGYDLHWRVKDADENERVKAAHDEFDRLVKIRDALPKEEAGTPNFDRMKEQNLGFDNPAIYDGRSERFTEAQQKVHEAYEKMFAEEKSYFRLNVWGMGRVADSMGAFGMLIDDGPTPDWPKAADYGLTQDQAEAEKYYPEDEYYTETYEAMNEGQHRLARIYQEDVEKMKSFHRGDTPGIPDRKFGSNDGWIVTPEESLAAVAKWRTVLDAVEKDGKTEVFKSALEEHIGWDLWQRWIAWLEGAAEHGGFEVW